MRGNLVLGGGFFTHQLCDAPLVGGTGSCPPGPPRSPSGLSEDHLTCRAAMGVGALGTGRAAAMRRKASVLGEAIL